MTSEKVLNSYLHKYADIIAKTFSVVSTNNPTSIFLSPIIIFNQKIIEEKT